MPTVATISITPVKALGLLHPAEVTLTRYGVEENRRYFLIGANGRLFNGIDHGPLVRVMSAVAGDRLTLLLPGGEVVDEVVELAGSVETDFYGRPVAGHVVAGPWAEALSGLAGEPLRLVRAERAGDACDVHVATVVSEASCAELGRRLGAAVDPRRFRMLLTLAGCAPHEEDTWSGRLVCAGEAVLRIGGPVPRCAITTQDPDTGIRTLDTLRGIKEYRGLRDGKQLDFGVYAEVEREGRVRVGDLVQPL